MLHGIYSLINLHTYIQIHMDKCMRIFLFILGIKAHHQTLKIMELSKGMKLDLLSICRWILSSISISETVFEIYGSLTGGKWDYVSFSECSMYIMYAV